MSFVLSNKTGEEYTDNNEYYWRGVYWRGIHMFNDYNGSESYLDKNILEKIFANRYEVIRFLYHSVQTSTQCRHSTQCRSNFKFHSVQNFAFFSDSQNASIHFISVTSCLNKPFTLQRQ